jgi:hypothetical protein
MGLGDNAFDSPWTPPTPSWEHWEPSQFAPWAKAPTINMDGVEAWDGTQAVNGA